MAPPVFLQMVFLCSFIRVCFPKEKMPCADSYPPCRVSILTLRSMTYSYEIQ